MRKKKEQLTPYDVCLIPLLKALRWRGTRRQLRESLPHYTRIKSASMLCDVLEQLNYESTSLNVTIDQIDEHLFPSLFVTEDKRPLILIRREGNLLEVFNPIKNKYGKVILSKLSEDKILSGTIYSFKLLPEEERDPAAEAGKPGWIRKTYLNNRPLVYGALGISFFMSLLALITPLFIMFVYNFVITASSSSMLAQFSIGVVVALVGFFFLSKVRSKQISIVGARFDHSIGDHIFERLLYLSPNYTESASLGSQVARLKDFSRLREFVTGQLMTTTFEMPFVIIGLAVIAFLGGFLVLVPIAAMFIYVLLSFLLYRESQRRLTDSSILASKQQEFVLETTNKLRAIKYTASMETWSERYWELSANSGLSNFRNNMLSGINNTISDFVTIVTGMFVLGFGAMMIIGGTLTSGAMLAIMIISWRILAPIKTVFNIYPRALQMKNSLQQISRLMHIKPESKPTDVSRARLSNLKGQITFKQVSFRYPETYQPALLGVEFNVNPGEIVAITGRNGSGKSSILKLLLCIYQQQGGAVLIDGQDIRQFNEIELRSLIGYLPQTPELFYGTIADNIRLSDPAAPNEMVEKAANQVGILETIKKLPNGFQTHIRDFSEFKLPASFQQELCLARALVKKSRILLLDEPSTALDKKGDEKFMNTLKQIHGRVTTLLVTHRPSHMKLVDKILVLDSGQLILRGKPKMVLPKIMKELE